MAQKHNSYEEKPMTRFGSIQGPSRRYRRLRNPSFLAAEWTDKNPLLQRGEIGSESDTHRIKIGDGTTYWNDLPYTDNASVQDITGSGNIVVTRTGNTVNVTEKTFLFEMAVAQTEWTINHNLNKRPSVTVVDSAGSVVECEVNYVDDNTCTIKTKAAFKGAAYLN